MIYSDEEGGVMMISVMIISWCATEAAENEIEMT
jgi:hypothetical protein